MEIDIKVTILKEAIFSDTVKNSPETRVPQVQSANFIFLTQNLRADSRFAVVTKLQMFSCKFCTVSSTLKLSL